MGYVIIGNSAAGIMAAQAIRSLDSLSEVKILTDEPHPAYARCLTSFYLKGHLQDEQLSMYPPEFYETNRINFLPEKRVVAVHSAANEVITSTGEVIPYNKLLIATGASPDLPQIPGMDADGVFGLRTLDQARAIRGYVTKGQPAVVVGGGPVALKAACALLEAGMQVTCVVASGRLFSRLLDKQAAEIVASKLVENGLKLYYNTEVTEIFQDDKQQVTGLALSNGEKLNTSLIIIGKGVKPNLQLLEQSEVKVDKGVLVNDYLQTNIPNIYAAGDVAQARDVVSGLPSINALWPNAMEQGHIAGRNMAGLQIAYEGSLSMNSADFFGLSVIGAGQSLVEDNTPGYHVFRFSPRTGIYRCLVFREDLLTGFILVGDTTKAGLLTTMVREKLHLGQARDQVAQGIFRQRILW